MEAPAAERTGSHLVGNSCWKNLCLVMQCEPAWARKPLGACCFCVGPLRLGGFLAAATTAVFMIFVTMPVFFMLRAKTFFKDETAEEFLALPFSVLLLRHLYNVFLLWTLFTGFIAIVSMCAIKRNEAAVSSRLACCSPPALMLSRLLRYGAYLFALALLFTRFHGHNVCLNYAVQEEVAAYRQACACVVNTTWIDINIPHGRCAPQNYVLCEPPEVDPQEMNRAHAHVVQACTACGLDTALLAGRDTNFTHRACTVASCLQGGCQPTMHTCPADEEDYLHSLQDSYGRPLHSLSQWGSDKPNPDQCHYEEGRLTSVQFVPDSPSSTPMLDDYLESGVLVLVENGQSMQDSLAALSDGAVRGSLNVSLGDEDIDEALSKPDGLSIQKGSCRLDVEKAMNEVSSNRETCSVMVTAWSLLFCLIGAAMCLHFSRVLFSLTLVEKPSTSPTATPVAETRATGAGENGQAAGTVAAERQEPWRAAWREAKNRPGSRKAQSIETGHVQLEDIEMDNMGSIAAGGGGQQPPDGAMSEPAQVQFAANARVARVEQGQCLTDLDVTTSASLNRIKSTDPAAFDVDGRGESPPPRQQADVQPSSASTDNEDDFNPRTQSSNRGVATPQDRIAAAISSARPERP